MNMFESRFPYNHHDEILERTKNTKEVAFDVAKESGDINFWREKVFELSPRERVIVAEAVFAALSDVSAILDKEHEKETAGRAIAGNFVNVAEDAAEFWSSARSAFLIAYKEDQ